MWKCDTVIDFLSLPKLCRKRNEKSDDPARYLVPVPERYLVSWKTDLWQNIIKRKDYNIFNINKNKVGSGHSVVEPVQS